MQLPWLIGLVLLKGMFGDPNKKKPVFYSCVLMYLLSKFCCMQKKIHAKSCIQEVKATAQIYSDFLFHRYMKITRNPRVRQ